MDELEKYYNYLRQHGADVPDTFASFKNTLADEPSAKKYYSYLRSSGFDAPETYDSFSNTFGLKKKSGTQGFSTSSTAGSSGLTPLVETQEQRDAYEKRLREYNKLNVGEYDEADPVGSVRKIVLAGKDIIKPSRVSSTAVAKPPEVQQELRKEEGTKRGQVQSVVNFFKEDTDNAISQLRKSTGLTTDQLYSDAYDEQLKSNIKNETDKVSYERLQQAKNARKAIASSDDIREVAANFSALIDPEFADQLQKLQSTGEYQNQSIEELVQGKPMEEVKNPAHLVLGDATMGRKLYDLMGNSAFQQEIKRNPELYRQFKEYSSNILNRYPEFGKTYLGSIISQKMEKMGMNNGVLNIVTKDEGDRVVSELVKSGEMNLQEQEFYKKNIRPRLGIENLGRAVVGKPSIKTPGLIESAAEGAVSGFHSLGKGITELAHVRDLVSGDKGSLSSDIESKERQVYVKPEGLWHEISQTGGQFLGQSYSIGRGSGLLKLAGVSKPAVSLGLSGGLQAYGNYKPMARMMFPDSKLKQEGFSLAMAGTEAFTEKIFDDRKVVKSVMKDFEPFVQRTIKDFTDKKITAAAATNQLQDAFYNAAKGYAKGVAKNTLEEDAAQLGQQVFTGLFENKPIDQWLDGEDLANTTYQSFLGSAFIAGLSANTDMMQNRGITSKQIYLMAQNPEYWKSQMEESAKTDPSLTEELPDKLDNLSYAANLLNELSNTDMTEKQKAKYLLVSLDNKVRGQSPQPSDTILKEQKYIPITENNKVKQDLLNGNDDGSFEGDKSDTVNSDEKKLFEEIKNVASAGYKATLEAAESEDNILGGLEYIQDKAAEDPLKFKNDFGEDLFNKVIKKTPTEKLQGALDFLIDTNPDNENVSVLDKLITQRESESQSVPPTYPNEAVEEINEPIQEDGVPSAVDPTTEETEAILPKEGDLTGITHAQMNEIADEFGLTQYEKDPQTIAEWDAEANNRIRKDPESVNKLMSKMREGGQPSAVEQRMMIQYISSLRARMRANPTRETLTELKRAKDLSNIAGGRFVGQSLVARKGAVPTEDTLDNYLTTWMDAEGTETMSQERIDELTKRYDREQSLKHQIDAAYEKGRQEALEERAKNQFNKLKSASKKGQKKDFKKEREEIYNSIKEKLKKSRGELSSLGAVKDLFVIAPDVAKLVKSYVEQGVTELADIVRNIHGDIKEDIPEITEKDIRDIIAGEYNERKETKNQIAAEIRRLQKEAKDPNVKERQSIQKKIDNLKKRIAEKDYSEEEKPLPKIKLDKETQKLKDEYIELIKEDALKQAKADYDKLSPWKKRWDKLWQVLGIRRLVQTAIDFSIPFRQAITITLNPFKFNTTRKAFADMFSKAFSPKAFDSYMYDLKESDKGREFENFGGVFSEPEQMKLDKREEEFRTNIVHNFLNRNNPVSKVLNRIWFSERAAAAFLNTARIEQYQAKDRQLRAAGLTPEDNEQEYKDAVKWIMNSTGRGNMLKLIEDSQAGRTAANNTFFGARLMASRINMLNPYYYYKMPKEVRVQAIKDMAGYTSGLMLTGLALAAAGGKVSFDPDDPDFLKVRFGNKTYDFSGGMNVYVRTFLRLIKASYSDKKYKDFATSSSWKAIVANKLSPNTAYAYHALTGKGGDGKDFDPKEILNVYPLYVDDVRTAFKDDGWSSLATVLAPAVFGVGVQNYPEKQGFESEDLQDPTFKYYLDRGLDLPYTRPENISVKDGTKEDKKISDYGDKKVKEFLVTRKGLLKENLKDVQKKGYVFVDAEGNISLTKDKGEEKKNFNDLSDEELIQVLAIEGRRATTEAKDKLFKTKR